MKPLIITIEKEDENGMVFLSRKLLHETIEQAYQGGYEDGKRETYHIPICSDFPAQNITTGRIESPEGCTFI